MGSGERHPARSFSAQVALLFPSHPFRLRPQVPVQSWEDPPLISPEDSQSPLGEIDVRKLCSELGSMSCSCEGLCTQYQDASIPGLQSSTLAVHVDVTGCGLEGARTHPDGAGMEPLGRGWQTLRPTCRNELTLCAEEDALRSDLVGPHTQWAPSHPHSHRWEIWYFLRRPEIYKNISFWH